MEARLEECIIVRTIPEGWGSVTTPQALCTAYWFGDKKEGDILTPVLQEIIGWLKEKLRASVTYTPSGSHPWLQGSHRVLNIYISV